MNLRILVLALLIPLIAHAGPPTGDRLAQVLDGPLSAEPTLDSKTIGTTIVAAVATQNTNKTKEDVQIFTVTNHNASTDLCFGTIPVTAAETCNDALCATASKWTGQGFAATMNCTNNDASKGRVILFHRQRTFAYDGTRCACIVAAAAGTIAQVERIVR